MNKSRGNRRVMALSDFTREYIAAIERATPADSRRMKRAPRNGHLPCPFCGGKAVVVKARWERDAWIVKCSHDGCADPDMCPIAPSSTPYISKAAATAGWNTRSRPTKDALMCKRATSST